MTDLRRDTRTRVMQPARMVGIVGYGAYLPRFRLPASEISRVWTEGQTSLPVQEKAVAGPDEDVVTMSIEAARNAIMRAGVDPQDIGAVWIGSESHPYAVKPTATIVAEAIGAVPHTQAADWQFACKGGTEAMQAAIAFVGSCMSDYACAIGMDTAQGRPGDALEYTAGSGGAAFLLGPADKSVAVVEGTYSFVTDTPDFWRRSNANYPQHGQRFTGEPAYFRHITSAAERLMDEMGTVPQDYDFAVFHQPNSKFPGRVGRYLGFTSAQLEVGLLAPEIGNVYAGSALVGLTAVLDSCDPGDRGLLVSFGSGAGSDAFQLRISDQPLDFPDVVPSTRDYLERRTTIDYSTYTRYRGKLALE